MLRSMYTSISGLRNHQTMLDVTANNIANVNTYGYKSSNVTFKDLLSQTLQGASAPTATLGGTNNRQVGLGMQLDSISQRHTQGALQTTGVGTDLALQGDGFFRVTNDATAANLAVNAQPTYYQRAGNLTLDGAGNLVTQDGFFVIGVQVDPAWPGPPAAATPDPAFPAAGQIVLNVPPATTRSWSIGQSGEVVAIDNTGTPTTIGWVTLAKFANPAGLTQAGSNKWTASTNSGGANVGIAGDPALAGTDFSTTTIAAGALEMSNVDLATEFTEMIKAQRGFQANSRVITTSDEILQELVNLKR